MKNSIIQWNCRGLKANYNELLLLINDYDPAVLCLQETFLKDSDNIALRNYTSYSSFSVNNGRAAGGVSVIVNNNAPHSKINLNSNLQAVAVSITLHRVITFCSIYIPPSSDLSSTDLDNLVRQLPSPFIILGDFNGHNILWGSKDLNDKGRKVEDFITRHNLCLYNDKSATYLHPATGSYTSIDLSLCYPTLYLDYDWKVLDDLCGSDHFPIILNNIGSSIDEPIPKWKLNKADWPKFQTLCATELQDDKFNESDDPIELYTSTLHMIAEETIPKTSKNSKRPKKPWYTDDCKDAINQRRAALRKFNARPTTANLDNCRIFRAKARRTIREAKKKTWRKYVSKLNTRTSTKKSMGYDSQNTGEGKLQQFGTFKC